jgi:exodeoxyribonuclease V alpha subunit
VAHLARALADDGDAGRVVDWLVNGTGPDGRPLAGVELHPLVEGRLPEAVLTSVVDATIRRLGPLLEAAPPAEGRTAFLQARLDDLEAFRVLAVHRAGALGVEGLTRNLLAALRERLPTRRFDGATWPGRPVLVTENRYDLDLRNGDVGLIVTGADGDRRAVFPSLGGSELRELAASRLPAHESAFVHTVHRAQGSQYPTVVVVLPAQASPLLTRELVYTAITRARSRLVLAADPAVLRQALSQRVERASTLAEGLSRHATR